MVRSIEFIPEGFIKKINVISSGLSSNECWYWKRLDKRGYGRYGGSGLLAHRLSYSHFTGPIPLDKHVCHSCDTPSCVNPEHLFIGSDADNMLDMRLKGRQRYTGSSILSKESLTEIKRDLINLPKRRFGRERFYKMLETKYGVCWQHIRQLATNKTVRLMDGH